MATLYPHELLTFLPEDHLQAILHLLGNKVLKILLLFSGSIIGMIGAYLEFFIRLKNIMAGDTVEVILMFFLLTYGAVRINIQVENMLPTDDGVILQYQIKL